MESVKIVAVSGGFDPIHIGHTRMFTEAKALGDRLVVILNNDNWLMTKKGFVFMPQDERAEVLRALRDVDEVVITDHEPNDPDRSVSRALAALRPHIFANGGDRKSTADIPEAIVCEQYGIEMIFNIGFGGKVQSSSWLTAQNALKRT
jgi:D-beta-D-heptose 7-phosphate kinase/D-beta-D-heptose 1-phosphate adenosyltransferase